MAGKIKNLIDLIIEKRSNGNPTIVGTTRAKLVLKGVNPNHYTASSEDDPAVIEQLRRIAKEFGVTV